MNNNPKEIPSEDYEYYLIKTSEAISNCVRISNCLSSGLRNIEFYKKDISNECVQNIVLSTEEIFRHAQNARSFLAKVQLWREETRCFQMGLNVYRKKPMVVQAYQTDSETIINTREGPVKTVSGDWVIIGNNGEQSLCRPDIFERTYESYVFGMTNKE